MDDNKTVTKLFINPKVKIIMYEFSFIHYLIEIIFKIVIIFISLTHCRFVFIHNTENCIPTNITSQIQDQFSTQTNNLVLKCDNLCHNPIKNESIPYKNNLFLFNTWRNESTSSAHSFNFPIKTNFQQNENLIIFPINKTKHP